ncbi:MAG: tubulin-like doman-containing protein [Candidatus Jordarchaeaceae archaeon]
MMGCSLVIGVGSLGTRVAVNIYCKSKQYGLSDLKVTAIDLATEETSRVPEGMEVFNPSKDISSDNNFLVQMAKKSSWFPKEADRAIDYLRNKFTKEMGAGRYRTIARLVFRELPVVSDKLYKHLASVARSFTENMGEKIRAEQSNTVLIWVVNSLAGGTGSGVFIDVARIAKEIFTKEGLTPYILGIGVIPDAAVSGDNPDWEENTFASITDLCWVQLSKEKPEPLDEKKKMPFGNIFNAYFLVSLPGANPTLEDAAKNEDDIASFVMSTLSVPVKNDVMAIKNDEVKGWAKRQDVHLIDWQNFLGQIPIACEKLKTETAFFGSFGIGGAYIPVEQLTDFCATVDLIADKRRRLEAGPYQEKITKAVNDFKAMHLDSMTTESLIGFVTSYEKMVDGTQQAINAALVQIHAVVTARLEVIQTDLKKKMSEAENAKKNLEILQKKLEEAKWPWKKSKFNKQLKQIQQQLSDLSDEIAQLTVIAQRLSSHANYLNSKIGSLSDELRKMQQEILDLEKKKSRLLEELKKFSKNAIRPVPFDEEAIHNFYEYIWKKELTGSIDERKQTLMGWPILAVLRKTHPGSAERVLKNTFIGCEKTRVSLPERIETKGLPVIQICMTTIGKITEGEQELNLYQKLLDIPATGFVSSGWFIPSIIDRLGPSVYITRIIAGYPPYWISEVDEVYNDYRSNDKPKQFHCYPVESNFNIMKPLRSGTTK